MEIVWIGEPHPEHDERVREDVRDLLADGLESTDDLITHLVDLGPLEEGPLIHVYGQEGKVFAEYIAKPEWKAMSDVSSLN